MTGEVLVRVDGVSKKFCRSLKKSLWYGARDVLSELNPFARAKGGKPPGNGAADTELRPDEFWAVRDVSFELRRGECLGLIGRNGAGKTTLLKMLNGLVKPDRGSIEMRGRVGALIALGAGFNPVLTGRENIYVNGSILGLSKREIDEKIDAIIDFADIPHFIDSPVQNYSSGMQVRLGFAVASSLAPDILLLDEVLAVGDMGFQSKCYNRLGQLRKAGTAFILVSHNMPQITKFCGNILYLKGGRVASFGPADRSAALLLKDMNACSTDDYSSLDTGPQEAGTLSCVVTKAFFSNTNGDPVAEISTGEPVTLVLCYRCHAEHIKNPVLELVLRDQTGDALFHGSSRMAGIELGTLRGDGMLTIAFPHMPANNMNLTAAIALWDSAMHELIYWWRGVTLRVNGDPNSKGRVSIPCCWKHQPQKTTLTGA
jgi:homopolymeric O-antigen transport system ATP-binding protein